MTAAAVDGQPDAAFFVALEARRTRALVERDLATLEALHAPDYQLIAPTGRVFSRADYLGAVAEAPFYTSWDIDGEPRARVAHGMAVLRYCAKLGFPSGRIVDVWHLDCYERREAGWQAVWSQATGASPAVAAAPRQRIGLVTLVVRDYDEAIAFFVQSLGFELVEDSAQPDQNKRWVVVRPPGGASAGVLLAQAASAEHAARVGDQTGGRVAFFLYSDDLDRDVAAYRARGVRFVREPQAMPYGRVAVFADLYGNLWDLLQPAAGT